MSAVKYEIVEHDGGWAYKVGDTYSETFASHDGASRAAHTAAREQVRPGTTTSIEYEDEKGRWHAEISPGDDRPEADVQD